MNQEQPTPELLAASAIEQIASDNFRLSKHTMMGPIEIFADGVRVGYLSGSSGRKEAEDQVKKLKDEIGKLKGDINRLTQNNRAQAKNGPHRARDIRRANDHDSKYPH